MLHLRNAIYIGSNKRASLFDLEIPEDYNGNFKQVELLILEVFLVKQ
jgi:hypothetical protein